MSVLLNLNIPEFAFGKFGDVYLLFVRFYKCIF